MLHWRCRQYCGCNPEIDKKSTGSGLIGQWAQTRCYPARLASLLKLPAQTGTQGVEVTQQLNTPWLATAPTGTATLNLRFPGQLYDAESGLHYNWNRYYDPKIGRYVTSDPRSVGKHVELMLDHMNASRLLRGAGVTMTPDVNVPPLELNPFAYVVNNPLRWADPTGENVAVPVILVGGSCFALYCAIQAWNTCEAAYPSSGGPENDRKRVSCAAERAKFCATFGFYIIDPIGSAVGTIVEETGKKTCKECGQ